MELSAIRLGALNNYSAETAYDRFRRCCGSSKWASRMAESRPFLSVAELEKTADRIWTACSRDDWLEAFAAHPKIGEQSEDRWSRQEQSGIEGAAADVDAALVEANQKYEAKFGYIFIVCATGKTAQEILLMIEQRLRNEPRAELQNAAEQQRLITRLRLGKLLSE